MTTAIQFAPLEPTPAMLAAAETIRLSGATFEEQYRAAMAAYQCRPAVEPADAPVTVSEEHGEELLEQLEDGMASPVAKELFQLIVTGKKDEALALIKEERMGDQDASDLYAYCRQKWTSKKLTLLEIPVSHAEEILKQKGQQGRLLVRQGLGVQSAFLARESGPLYVIIANGESCLVSELQQLWLVVAEPVNMSSST